MKGLNGTLVIWLLLAPVVAAAGGDETQARLSDDLGTGRPVVIHVVVALCDNANQGIVPVPNKLGDGRDPGSNLYWGALYGLRTHITRILGSWKYQRYAHTHPTYLPLAPNPPYNWTKQ